MQNFSSGGIASRASSRFLPIILTLLLVSGLVQSNSEATQAKNVNAQNSNLQLNPLSVTSKPKSFISFKNSACIAVLNITYDK